ncbi:MAG: anaerobic ribonucleoside-triphosphate reductase activating protein [Turicibacter sp.]|nr:anaerobic ribonucleoside-triphosphate reductase activating protein [Turicibacter sp.]
MNYAQIRKYDIANGPGVRASLFVSGCTHNCPGCFNQDYMRFNYGGKWSKQVEDEFIEIMTDSQIKGVTILGGEPMDQIGDDDLLHLVQRIKSEVGKSIWLYSGYTYEEILADKKRREILSFCDVLVDGLFVESLKNLKLRFRGSSNQRIIDISRSMASGAVQMLESYE